MHDQGPASHAMDCRKQQVGNSAAQKSGPGRSGECNRLQCTVACSSGFLRRLTAAQGQKLPKPVRREQGRDRTPNTPFHAC